MASAHRICAGAAGIRQAGSPLIRNLPLRRLNFFDKASSFLGGGGNMVTHSELILIGQLIVSILTLFVHIYDNKKK